MKAPIVVTALTLALGALPLAGMERAQPREGGASRGGDSGATARQPSSGGGSSGGSHVSGGGYERSSGSSQTTAQRRHPRPGTGTGRGGYHGRGGYYRGYYGGYYGYYPGYYGYYDWWYGPGWYSGYYPGYAYRYRYYDYDDNGALRLQIKPNAARVYVDGYYTGVVDDFDGLFQRLNLPPGRHELSFKLEGYKTHRVRLYVPPDQTLKLRYDLVPGEGEDTVDDSLDKPGLEWAERERQRSRDRRDRYGYRERDRDAARESPRESPREGDAAESEPGDAPAGSAVLSLEVQPEQAAVYVDGAFRGTGRDIAELNLPPGRHRVEVVAPGFKTFDREVEVKPGDTQTVTIELERP
jgi:hypothetical protein